MAPCPAPGDRSLPVLYGAAYSVYTRIARLALAEKGIDYRLEEVDVFAAGGVPTGHLARHPFGRIPAFVHDGFQLYEAGAIARYVDEAFPGPSLQPAAAQDRARMNQVTSILDSYGFHPLVLNIFVCRASGPTPDAARVQAALPASATCLDALANIMGKAPFLAGPMLSLADLHAVPMFAYLRTTPEGAALLAAHPALERWWQTMAARPAVRTTRFAAEAD